MQKIFRISVPRLHRRRRRDRVENYEPGEIMRKIIKSPEDEKIMAPQQQNKTKSESIRLTRRRHRRRRHRRVRIYTLITDTIS